MPNMNTQRWRARDPLNRNFVPECRPFASLLLTVGVAFGSLGVVPLAMAASPVSAGAKEEAPDALGTWRKIAAPLRWGNTATKLADGKVLMAGGCPEAYASKCARPSPTS